MAHHKDEFGPSEPDMGLYANYPITRASMRRKLTRDLFFVSGWKNLKGLLLALKSPKGRPLAARILGVQPVICTWAEVATIGHGVSIGVEQVVGPWTLIAAVGNAVTVRVQRVVRPRAHVAGVRNGIAVGVGSRDT